MSMTKKERKETIVKVSRLLRSGIETGNKEHITEAFRWLDDLMADHGVFVLDDEMPRFPSDA